jgi:FkbH-like protein
MSDAVGHARRPRTFLEAHRLARSVEHLPATPLQLAMSGTGAPLEVFLRAAAAGMDRHLSPQFLPFNTLSQALRSPRSHEREVVLLCPWDMLAALDWRSGVSAVAVDDPAVQREIEDVVGLLRARSSPVVYLPAPIPPCGDVPDDTRRLLAMLEAAVRALDPVWLDATLFSLPGYLTSGCPIDSRGLDAVAEAIVHRVFAPMREPAKVLVTDLDNTLWAGIVGDDGATGLYYGPEGRGFRLFILQTFLRRLQERGVLLAAVSKNDAETALAPLRSGHMVLNDSHFVAVMASWNAKSAQIAELARQLNLSLDAFVFLDDNPVELAEVGLALPGVRCVSFESDAKLPAVLDTLHEAFGRRGTTNEDRERTALYRRRLEGIAPVETSGADLSTFLHGLEMALTIRDRTRGDRTRAVQLINKTNQFNLNGRRWSDEEVAAVLDAGGRLWGMTLEDRTGTHGEILACLLDAEGTIQALVLSCRVFQRRVEQAFMAWLAATASPTALAYEGTPRNGPLQQFLTDTLGALPLPGRVPLSSTALVERYGETLAYFRLEVADVT